MKHDPDTLSAIDANAICVESLKIKKTSSFLSLLEYKNQKDVDICEAIYNHKSLRNQKGLFSKIFFSDEVHLTKAGKAGIINKNNDFGFPLWEGKMINIFDTFYEKPQMWINETTGKLFLSCRNDNEGLFWFENYRLSYRRVAASTNERTIISTIIPAGVFSSYSLYNILCVTNKSRAKSIVPDPATQLLLLCLLSSFIFDYIARLKFSINLVPSEVCEIPVPEVVRMESMPLALIARAARSICVIDNFNRLWKNVFTYVWNDSFFWYPQGGISIDSYGPAHEQEIRRSIAEQASSLTKEWTPACGVYDRTPDRRDTGDRAQFRAEIDAYVAHLYGLSRDDFSYILDTFPVLKRKEEKAFGEYMSKRKCLEEYDRIATIL